MSEKAHAILELVARPSEHALSALAAPDARLCVDMRVSPLADGLDALVATLRSLPPAQRAGLTALGHDSRTVLIAPAVPGDPSTRKVFVFTHPGAGPISEIVAYTDEPAEENTTFEPAPLNLPRAAPVDVIGERVLVTASSDTLGFTIGSAFLQAGASVVFHGTRPAVSLPEARDGATAAYLPADLAVAANADELVVAAAQALGGPISILVNNLGPWDSTPLSQLSEQAWLAGIQANLGAALRMSQLVAPGMREAGRGRIVMISAGSAFVRDHGLYGFAKAALTEMTEALALELAPQITVNAVAPGQIEESLDVMNGIDPTAVPRMLRRTPAGRFVTRAEVAEAVLALTRAPFDLLTGAVVPLDGGHRIVRS